AVVHGGEHAGGRLRVRRGEREVAQPRGAENRRRAGGRERVVRDVRVVVGLHIAVLRRDDGRVGRGHRPVGGHGDRAVDGAGEVVNREVVALGEVQVGSDDDVVRPAVVGAVLGDRDLVGDQAGAGGRGGE